MRQSFENDVKTYGTQANYGQPGNLSWFENDVKTYGTQASPVRSAVPYQFENDVKIWSLFVKNGDQRNVAR